MTPVRGRNRDAWGWAILGAILGMFLVAGHAAIGQDKGSPADPARQSAAAEGQARAAPPFETGTADRLRDMDPEGIESMRIVLLRRQPRGEMLEERAFDLGPKECAIVCGLLRKAEPQQNKGMEEAPPANDAMVQVMAKNGARFQIPYASYLRAPFGKWQSRPLKEALWAISHVSRLSVVRLEGEKVAEVTEIDVPPAGGALGSLGPAYEVSLVLNPAGSLVCNLRLGTAREPALTLSHQIAYGQALCVPARRGDALYVVLLQTP